MDYNELKTKISKLTYDEIDEIVGDFKKTKIPLNSLLRNISREYSAYKSQPILTMQMVTTMALMEFYERNKS